MVLKYRGGYKYQVAEHFMARTSIRLRKPALSRWCGISEGGIVWARPGYAWDGPSGPTWDFKSRMRASLIHDILYQLIREGLLGPEMKRVADREFWWALQEDAFRGCESWRWPLGVLRWAWSWAAWAAVAIFGGGSCRPGSVRDVEVAPGG